MNFKYIILLIILENSTALACSYCVINSLHLDKSSPVLLLNGHILYPNKHDKININDSDIIEAVCPGTYINFTRGQWQSTTITCTNRELTMSGHVIQMKDLKCKSTPQTTVNESRNPECNQRFIQIGVNLQNRFHPRIDVCFNNNTLHTLWTAYDFKKTAKGCTDVSTNFKTSYFESVNINNLYNHSGWDKGHLVPRCDFRIAIEQLMTFYYINSAPQVKEFNRGRWRVLEDNIRSAAQRRNKGLRIYTGTHEIKEIRNRPQYLSEKELVPVPKYFWKVVICETTQRGVAFFSKNDVENNHHLNLDDVCAKISWIGNKGKINCYRIEDFRTINDIDLPLMQEYNQTQGLLMNL